MQEKGIGMTISVDQKTNTLLERARAAAVIVEQEADAGERDRTITQPVVDALIDARLFWTLIPKEFGGEGATLVEGFEVIEEISRADASAGWALMANSFSTGIAAGYLPEKGARELFDKPTPGITAGMILPTGKGVPVEGGYRVTGDFQFASGSAHADWIGAGWVVSDEEGNPILDDDGQVIVRTGFIPREKIEFRGNWDVLGLVGTGSYDYGVIDVFVPEEHTFNTFSTTPVRSEPVYALGLLGIGVGGHAPVALGIARRALDEIATIARQKGRLGYATVIGDSELFKIEFAKAEALYQATRLFVYDVHSKAEEKVTNGEALTPLDNARLRQSITWSQETASKVVDFAHRWAGSASIRNPSALGRCVRDAAVATQHLLVDPMTLVDAATAILPEYGE